MWNFPQYTSKERAFSFSQDTLEMTEAGAGARAGVGASRTVLRIRYESSSEYLGTLVEVEDFGPWVSSGYLEISDLGDGEKLEGATERATEGCFWRKRLQARAEIILKLIFF